MKNSRLVIVPCGQQKIWTKRPEAGPTAAMDAYTGAPFVVNRAFAKTFGERWVVLSAKYGFIDPDFKIPGPYNVTFKDGRTGPISGQLLWEQVRQLRLDRFAEVIRLGGKEYRSAVEMAFAGTEVKLHFPFSGLPIGKAMQATKRAIAANDPLGTGGIHGVSPTEHVCDGLHRWLSQFTAFGFPYPETQVPRNGIYVLFEKGETAHGANRVVRIGTHTGNNQLRSRLTQHFLHEKKDRSIFRKNIGRCLLNREHDAFLASWELDLTSREARQKHQATIDFEKQNQVEQQVTDYIRSHFKFVVFDIPDKDKRLKLESMITSTVSLCPGCGPSGSWLGHYSPVAKIRASGLWQVNGLYKTPLNDGQWSELVSHSATPESFK